MKDIIMGHPGTALYSICKAAVDMAIRQLALEYAPQGLRVSSVAPVLMHTPAIDSLRDDTANFLKNRTFTCNETAQIYT